MFSIISPTFFLILYNRKTHKAIKRAKEKRKKYCVKSQNVLEFTHKNTQNAKGGIYMSENGKETLKQIFDRVNKMDAAQRERVMQVTEALLFLHKAKKN